MKPNAPLVEVMVPALDEAGQIGEVVANAREVGPVFVLDAGSRDQTANLARAAGATVLRCPPGGFGSQKNWALAHLPFRGRWVLALDADERISTALTREIREALGDASGLESRKIDAFSIPRQLLFLGRRIRHGGAGPGRALRLFRRGFARYDGRPVHERLICQGSTASLRSPLLHLRNRSLGDYIARQIRFADIESDLLVRRSAPLALAPGARVAPPDLGLAPCRALWRLVSMYALQLGFLDGAAGWHLARLAANYEYMTRLMFWDKIERARRLGPADAALTSALAGAEGGK